MISCRTRNKRQRPTAQHCQRQHVHQQHRPPLIFGTSGAVDTPGFQHALEVGIQSGITAIEISRRFPTGEQVVGNVVRGLHHDDVIPRSHVCIASRVGQHVGSPDDVSKLTSSTSGALQVDHDRMLCLSGDFIRDQVHQTLEESGMDYLDMILLDNIDDAIPFLSDQNQDHNRGREELYARLPEAFAALEDEVKAGRIGGYGVGMWGYGTSSLSSSSSSSSSSSCILDISKICNAAGSGLQAIQIPSVPNLLMNANSLSSTITTKTAEAARRAGLWVIGDRPLTHQDEEGKILGYREYDVSSQQTHPESDAMDSLLQDVHKSVAACAALEDSRPFLEGGSGDTGDECLPPLSSLSWGHIIGHNLHQIDTILTWRHVRRTRIEPELEWALAKLRRHPEGRRYHDWMTRYRMMTLTMFNSVHRLLEHKAAIEMQQVRQGLDRLLFNNNNNNNNNAKITYEKQERPSVPQTILSAVLGSGFLDSVVVGMKRVEEVLDMAQVLPLDQAQAKAVMAAEDVRLHNIPIEMGTDANIDELKKIKSNNNENNDDNIGK